MNLFNSPTKSNSSSSVMLLSVSMAPAALLLEVTAERIEVVAIVAAERIGVVAIGVAAIGVVAIGVAAIGVVVLGVVVLGIDTGGRTGFEGVVFGSSLCIFGAKPSGGEVRPERALLALT